MSKAEKFLYFAFGSNLLKERLQLKNPSAVYKTIAKLENHKLSFWCFNDPSSNRWRGSVANIEPDDGNTVWGTVWELSVTDIPSLDKQESSYNAIEVDVITEDNSRLRCRTYQVPTGEKTCEWPNLPSPHYMDIIVRGAEQSRLPSDYIQNLRKIETNGFTGKVSIYEEALKMLQK